jgi:hypothetical protein
MKEMSCTTCDSDYNTINLFDKIQDDLQVKDKSKLMVMKDEHPCELWDWGLNEKVVIPNRKSSCLEICMFIAFIKTRKW